MLKTLLIKLLAIYKYLISPLLGPNCRFHPTCSQYAVQSLEKHHTINALKLIFKRILKCHPFHEGGVDFP